MNEALITTFQSPIFLTISSFLLYAIIDSVRDEINERKMAKPQPNIEPEISYFQLGNF